MHPDRAFKMLVGSGATVVFLVVAAVYRVTLAGCPDVSIHSTLACLFVPTGTDLGIHLISYVFAGVILLGTFSWLVLWQRQRVKMRLLTSNLALLQTTDSNLEPLTWRLGLKNQVRILDFETTFCFCAGFISPHIYLSRGIVPKLTLEELEALLLHEKHHLKNYDSLKILLGKFIVSALFFIPVLKDLFERYLIEKEIAADQSAIRYQGNSRGIIGTLEKFLREPSATPIVGLAASGADALSHRINHLKGHAPQYMYRIPISHLATSFLITALILAAILAPLSGSHS